MFCLDYSAQAYTLDEVVIRLELPEIKELIHMGYEIGNYVRQSSEEFTEIIAQRKDRS